MASTCQLGRNGLPAETIGKTPARKNRGQSGGSRRSAARRERNPLSLRIISSSSASFVRFCCLLRRRLLLRPGGSLSASVPWRARNSARMASSSALHGFRRGQLRLLVHQARRPDQLDKGSEAFGIALKGFVDGYAHDRVQPRDRACPFTLADSDLFLSASLTTVLKLR